MMQAWRSVLRECSDTPSQHHAVAYAIAAPHTHFTCMLASTYHYDRSCQHRASHRMRVGQYLYPCLTVIR
eukprot:1680796-Rhodomonas_salina.4